VIRTKYLVVAMSAALAAMACQPSANTKVSVNTNAQAVNTANANSGSSTNANAAAGTLEPGDLAGSPTEVYKAAYMARKNCDVPTLKKLMSKDILKFLADMGKTDKKELDEELKEICAQPQAPSQQVRNEKIEGDHASLEYMNEEGHWETMDFVKEDGVWKMSVGKGDQPYPDDDDAPTGKGGKDDHRS